MEAWGFVFLAYGIVWGMISLYVMSLHYRVNRASTLLSTLAEEQVFTSEAPLEFYSVGVFTVALLSLSTLGLYDFYWLYKQWKSIRQQHNEDLSPFVRAWFGPYFAFHLFRRVKISLSARGNSVYWNPGLLALLYFVFSGVIFHLGRLLIVQFLLAAIFHLEPLLIVQFLLAAIFHLEPLLIVQFLLAAIFNVGPLLIVQSSINSSKKV